MVNVLDYADDIVLLNTKHIDIASRFACDISKTLCMVVHRHWKLSQIAWPPMMSLAAEFQT